jgi:hypothetical protein
MIHRLPTDANPVIHSWVVTSIDTNDQPNWTEVDSDEESDSDTEAQRPILRGESAAVGINNG